jgi:hypothetical protein
MNLAHQAEQLVASSAGHKFPSMIIAMTDGTLAPDAFTLTKQEVSPADGYQHFT